MSARPNQASDKLSLAGPGPGAESLPGVSVFRGESLEELLPRIRAELGPDAIILCEREGVVGGIAGFFARRCVEVEACARAPLGELVPQPAVSRPVMAEPVLSVPARVATGAYATAAGSLDDLGPDARTEVLGELTFADLLAQAGTAPAARFEEPPAPAPAPTPAPAAPVHVHVPGDDEADVRRALHESGFPDAEADELVRYAMLHARPFAPHAPLRDVVRATLAETLQTPLGWKARRRVLVLAGTEGAGASEVAAALCAGYARVGLSVAALGLDGIRSAVALATHTEDAAVAVGVAEDAGDVARALPRLGRPDLLVAVAPTIVPGDEARRARTAELLAGLPAHDLHLVVPAGATAADVRGARASLDGIARVKGILPVALDEAPTIGGVVSVALRERLEIRWTASGDGAVRLAPAGPADLAARALP